MKKFFGLYILTFTFLSCHKDNTPQTGCNLQEVYSDNAKKVTITSGIWGTVSFMEGNCMPTVLPSTNSCKNCPVQRTVKIYRYTTLSNAVTSDPDKIFFDSFNTQLIAQVDTDDKGFFQVDIPAGHYSIIVVENGKLYANEKDGQGGLNPFTLSSGIQSVDITMTYRAVF
jgi:hypothetical protein